jgi:hypothetical protein
MANFFRFFTLLGLRVFAVAAVDAVILEVGLGGRLDATNVIEKPVVCGVTTLDLDHTRVLGATIDLIAREVESMWILFCFLFASVKDTIYLSIYIYIYIYIEKDIYTYMPPSMLCPFKIDHNAPLSYHCYKHLSISSSYTYCDDVESRHFQNGCPCFYRAASAISS